MNVPSTFPKQTMIFIQSMASDIIKQLFSVILQLRFIQLLKYLHFNDSKGHANIR